MDQINPNTVRYLSVEGGGAAGLTVHPGAIHALEKRGILRYDGYRQVGVQAFAGSSSGSVIATLVSCGYRHSEIADLLHPSAFDMIFRLEDMRLGEFSMLGGCGQNRTPPHQDQLDDDGDAGVVSVFLRTVDPLGWALQKPKEFEDYLTEKLNDTLSPKRMLKTIARRRARRLANIPRWVAEVADDEDNEDDNPGLAYEVLKDAVINEIVDRAAKAALNAGRREFLKFVKREYPHVVFKVLDNILQGRHSPGRDAFNILRLDYGLFSGCEWRNYIDHAIALAAFRVKHADRFARVKPPGPADFGKTKNIEDLFHGKVRDAYAEATRDWPRKQRREMPVDEVLRDYNLMRHLTFDEHWDIFYGGAADDRPPPLNLTGANLSTQTSHVFSALDANRFGMATGWFRISDAVRIATGIPPAFKPFIIRRDDLPDSLLQASPGRHFLEGMWMDGGVYYNSPVDLFRKYETPEARTLGLGIGDEDTWVEIGNVSEFYASMINVVYERNISRTRTDMRYFIPYDNFGLALHSERQTDQQIKLYQMDAYYRTQARIARNPLDSGDPFHVYPSSQ